VADYGNDPNWRAGVTQMRPSTPGTAQAGVTTLETLGASVISGSATEETAN
jgi:hypothetical protein